MIKKNEIESPDRMKRLLDALLEISYYVGSVMELEDILEKITEITVRVMDADVSSVYLIDDNGKDLVLRATTGFDRTIVNKGRFAVGKGLPGWVCAENNLIALDDAHKDDRFESLEGADDDDCKAFLCYPLRIQERVIGCMTVRNRYEYQWSDEEITTFEAICKQVGIVTEKAQLYYGKIKLERLAAMTLSLSGVAHYIKNLLQGMSGGSYIVDNGIEKEDFKKVQQGWEVLRKSSRKLSYLVENMLNFSRSSKPDFEREQITTLTDDLVEHYVDTLKELGYRLIYEKEENIPEILIDSTAIMDALTNLMSNAIDAIPEEKNGDITIRVFHDKVAKRVVVEMSDNGLGIPEDIQQHIFELFYTTKGNQGTGLGLAVTKKIVDEHFGEIHLKSKTGEGTTFSILFPLAESAELRAQTSRASGLSLQ